MHVSVHLLVTYSEFGAIFVRNLKTIILAIASTLANSVKHLQWCDAMCIRQRYVQAKNSTIISV